MDMCESRAILQQNKVKITKQRVAILDEIINFHEYFSINQLHQKLPQEDNIDLATVYRFVNLLSDLGVVRQIAVLADQHFYEHSCLHHPVHPHFICDKCQKIQCLPDIVDSDKMIFNKILKDVQYSTISSVNLTFNGICSCCVIDNNCINL